MKILINATDEIAIIGRSMCMRFIIHIVGDIHQPLHAASLFSDEFPTGDMGGTLFEIKFAEKLSLNQLHKFWDSTANKYSEFIEVPISFIVFNKLQEIAHEIGKKYNREILEEKLKIQKFDEWAEESRILAYEIAYDALKLQSGDPITEEYLERARELIDHQLALGGLRLADTLRKIFQ